ncbi:coiled-coil alpha-helical rod protein 1 isoform X2 [Stigmatopora argus]
MQYYETRGKPQDDLIPPSHFASSLQASGASMSTQPSISWMKPKVLTTSPKDAWLGSHQTRPTANPGAAIILGNGAGGRTPEETTSALRTRSKERTDRRSRWEEEECILEGQRQKAEAERLNQPMEALKETLRTYVEEITIKNDTISRQCHELETMRQEMSKVKSDLNNLKEDLKNCHSEKEKIMLQLEKQKSESEKVVAEMRTEARLKAETMQKQADDAEDRSLRMSQKLQQRQKKQEEELRHLRGEHYGELCTARKFNDELQSQLESASREVLQLKSHLLEASAERDDLKEHLSKMETAYDTQSATLRSLRNYIGQVVAHQGEKDQSGEAMERLHKEKATLQKTAELLNVRLDAMSQIVSLQEQKMLKKASAEPLLAKHSDALLVLHLWREKVFQMCVQLRLKDVGSRDERGKHLAQVRVAEQRLQEEQHRATVLGRTLDAGVAELDQEKVQKEALKQDLTQICKEHQELKAKCFNSEAEVKRATEALHSFHAAFRGKMADVNAAQAKLNTFSQRLNFASGRVETLQALLVRRMALRKVQKSSTQEEQAAESIRSLQLELSAVTTEKSQLARELRKTPQLIDKALADMKEECEVPLEAKNGPFGSLSFRSGFALARRAADESKLERQRGELERCREQAQKAEAGGEELGQNLRDVLARLEGSEDAREELRSRLLSQKERGQQALQERLSEMESCCAEKLREMEAQLSAVKKEHTKAVRTLRELEIAVARKQEHWRGPPSSQSQHTKELQAKPTEEAERNPRRFPATVSQPNFPRAATTALKQNVAAPEDQGGEKACQESGLAGAKLAAEERLLCVLEELHALSAAVVNSSEDSAEEDEEEEHRDLSHAVLGTHL